MRTTIVAAGAMLVSGISIIGSGGCGQEGSREPSPWAGEDEPDGSDDDDDADGTDAAPLGLDETFAEIGAAYDVPPALLAAIGHVETRWEMIEGHEEMEGRPPAYGIMGLRGTRLEEAAALAGLEVDAVKTDVAANIEAAAAWLSVTADELEISDRTDLGAWADTVAVWSDLPEDWARSAYVYVEVYPRLREGAIEYDENGDVRGELEPVDAWPSFTVPPPEPALGAGPDYELSLWRPSPNYSSRPAGTSGATAMIIIHTCEGAYVGCYSWLTNTQSGVSAHYVVNSTGSEISQLVRESKKGWHISAKYDCSRNENHECFRNGASSNNFTVGIEHAGFANQGSWDPGLIDASARLVCNIAKDNGISIDDVHIVAHGRLQPYNRIDPGPKWPWDEYLELAKSYCNEAPEPEPEPEPEPQPDPVQVPATFIIDSNNANNDDSYAFSTFSSGWTRTSATAGYQGSDYLYASLGQAADPGTFWFYMPQAGSKTVAAWWTAGTNRTTSAHVLSVDANGVTKGDVVVDQTINGKAWRTIGTYQFTAGWNKVQVSRQGSGTRVVIADAIQIK